MSEQNVIRIVVDTNIWISFLIGRTLDSLVDSIKTKKIEVCFSQELHDELFNVMTRPKFKSQISEVKIAEVREIISSRVTTIKPDRVITDCRDPKDNFLLELAVTAHADYLVTGDEDLIDLNPYHGLKIVKVKEFEKILHTKG